MIVPVSDPQLVFRPLLIAGKILPLRASKSISRGQGRRNGSEPGAQAESLQCISARIVSVPCIAGGPFPGTAPAAPRGGGPCVANGRLRHTLISYAHVSKTDGSQLQDLQRDACGHRRRGQPLPRPRFRRPRRPAGTRQLPARPPGWAGTSPTWSTRWPRGPEQGRGRLCAVGPVRSAGGI